MDERHYHHIFGHHYWHEHWASSNHDHKDRGSINGYQATECDHTTGDGTPVWNRFGEIAVAKLFGRRPGRPTHTTADEIASATTEGQESNLDRLALTKEQP